MLTMALDRGDWLASLKLWGECNNMIVIACKWKYVT
jgi:hypothetical protein